jgi:hypothetical protein
MLFCKLCKKELVDDCEKKYGICNEHLTLISNSVSTISMMSGLMR